MKKIRKKITVIILLLSVSGLLQGCRAYVSPGTPVVQTGFYLDTVVSITLYGQENEPYFAGCWQLLETYEQLFSKTLPGSDIFRINAAEGSEVEVSPETFSLLETALAYARLSGGLVDPTIGTLSSLWKFGDDGEASVPSAEEVREALSHVDYQNVILHDNRVQLTDPCSRLDLGFIAKGYIADRLKEYLTAQGVTSGIINLGGNVLTIGTKPDGSAYKVGVRKPSLTEEDPLTTISLQDASLVTSGSYERFFVVDGQRYHHILSTVTGYPVESGLSSVSVISRDSVDGDALSTLCFILGYEEAHKLIDSLDETEAVYVDADGNLLP